MSVYSYRSDPEDRFLQGLLQWCRRRPDCAEPDPNARFRRINPEWIRRFALRDALLPWVKERTGLPSFYPDELDADSTPHTLARHLAQRFRLEAEPPARTPVISFREGRVKEPTIFILNCPRSGSTLFRCMLMGHPSLYAPPELHLAGFRTMRKRERQITDSGLYWKTIGLAETIAHLNGWNKWQAFHYVSHLTKRDMPVEEVYRLIHRLCQKPILVDKSPSLTNEISTLKRVEESFENAKYLFMTRHPYAVIESMMRNQVAPPRPRDTFAAAESRWTGANSNVLSFLESVPRKRWHKFSFENLMANTEQTLREVTDFLEIPYSNAMADTYEGDRLMLGIGCINLPKRKRVEKELGELWKHVRLPSRLSKETETISARLGYRLPATPTKYRHTSAGSC